MNLVYVVFSIIAAVKARKGEFYYFLFFGSYAYDVVYKMTNPTVYVNEQNEVAAPVNVNAPPF